jgi:mannose/fructose/N-acetylgalactosamine-specific phosphotransferase system component IID
MNEIAKGNVLGPLLFLVYVNYIRKSTESTIRDSADDCIIYRKALKIIFFVIPFYLQSVQVH